MANDFTAFAGDTLVLRIAVSDEEDAPLSLDGYTATYRIAASVGAPALVQKTTGGGGITLLAGGVVEVLIADGDTDDLNGMYRHELQLVKNGAESTALSGNVFFEARMIQ